VFLCVYVYVYVSLCEFPPSIGERETKDDKYVDKKTYPLSENPPFFQILDCENNMSNLVDEAPETPFITLTGPCILPDDIYILSEYQGHETRDIPTFVETQIRKRRRDGSMAGNNNYQSDQSLPSCATATAASEIDPDLGGEGLINDQEGPAHQVFRFDDQLIIENDRDREFLPQEFDEKIQALQEIYVVPIQKLNELQLRQWSLQLFHLEEVMVEGVMCMADITAGYNRNINQVYKVYLHFMRHGKVAGHEKTAQSIMYQQVFNQILGIIYHIYAQLSADYKMKLYAQNQQLPDEEEISINRFTPRRDTKLTPYQTLILFLLHKAYNKGYRLYREACYKQIYYNGFPTHAWKHVCPVSSFIYGSIDRDTNFDMWQHLLSAKNNDKQAEQYLLQAQDKEFPTLKPDRHLFSFRNGVYDAKTLSFHPYSDNNLDSSRVAIRYFDVEFDVDKLFVVGNRFEEIETPEIDTILDFQKLSLDVKNIVFAFLGRCLYDVGEMDSWEVILFIKGVARSGKSTLGKLLQYLFPQSDVAILSSNIEPRFGLSAIFDKLLFLCFEVKANWGLDQGDFQCMLSGEEVSVPVKHKISFNTMWKVPGMLMGNEVAKSWLDAAGSLSRRVLLLEFLFQVKESDSNLFARIKQNIAAIIHKINLAYHVLVAKTGSSSIWNNLPEYFLKTKENLSAAINPLVDFLTNNSSIRMEPTNDQVYMPFDDFRDLYTQHCARNQFKVSRFNRDHYGTVFEQYALTVKSDTRIYQGKMRDDIKWVIGVNIKDDDGPIEHH